MILRSQSLAVEVAEVGADYRGPRFDWTGFVRQVTFRDQHTFCTAESIVAGQGTGGSGLCNEFGIFNPVGYHDSRPGEKFPKFGVGLLTRPAGRHDFAAEYEIEPFPVTTKQGADFVIYDMQSLPCRGYEAQLRKKVQVHEASLEITYELRNVGTKPISTQEYNHNFIAVNGHPPGPTYRLRLADGITLAAHQSPGLAISEEEVRWTSQVKKPFVMSTLGPFEARGACWDLLHEPSGVGVREAVDIPVSQFSLWCTSHVIAPEVFVKVEVQPCETKRWGRRFEFFAS